jgi:hypothetical protein
MVKGNGTGAKPYARAFGAGAFVPLFLADATDVLDQG